MSNNKQDESKDNDEDDVQKEIGVWVRAACAWADAQGMKVVRFGDNMRDVAVTEGNKVSAQIQLGYDVYGYGMGADIMEKSLELASNDYDLKKKYDFSQVEIVRDPDPSLDTVECDATEIEQVILNLVKNAAQAMALGGSPYPHRITLRTRREEGYARIEVEDSGPGMDEATRRRVFEPFFTTKAVGAGTGLGLSVSYFIITEQHKGTIEVNSAPGEGTCFIVRLPLKAKPR